MKRRGAPRRYDDDKRVIETMRIYSYGVTVEFLADFFGWSPVRVRKALEALHDEGRVESFRPSGAGPAVLMWKEVL